GASIPLGPWNMAVLWVVIRGWGRPVAQTTRRILVYGIFRPFRRVGLMFIAGLVLVAVEATKRPVNVEQAVITGYLIVGGVLFIGLGVGLTLFVHSDARASQRG